MIPDNETLERLKTLRNKMPDPVTQRRIDEYRRQREDPFLQEALRRHQEFRNQVGDQIKSIADSLAGNETLRMMREYSQSLPTSFASRDRYFDTLNVFREATRGLPFETVNSVAQAMRQFQNGPAWAALETMRQIGLGKLVDEFPDFEETIITEAPTAEPKQVERAVRKFVVTQKKRGPTKEQWDALMRFITVFSLLMTFYFGLQQGKTVNKTIILQPPFKDAAKAKSYWVVRPCELKVRPNFKSPTIALVPKDVEVHVIFTNRQWLYVEYEPDGQDVPKYGYVSKKYLKKIE